MTNEPDTSTGKRRPLVALALAGFAVVAAIGVWLAVSPGSPAACAATADTVAYQPPQRVVEDRAEQRRAQAYALAIRTLADKVGHTGDSWPVLFVYDHTCASVVSDPGTGDCDPAPIPRGLRAAITEALSGYAPVKFVGRDAELSYIKDGRPAVKDDGAIVDLGRAEFSGDTATIPLSVVGSGGLNAEGSTYELNEQGGTWRVTGTTGGAWIA